MRSPPLLQKWDLPYPMAPLFLGNFFERTAEVRRMIDKVHEVYQELWL
jgi:hypothetical protein